MKGDDMKQQRQEHDEMIERQKDFHRDCLADLETMTVLPPEETVKTIEVSQDGFLSMVDVAVEKQLEDAVRAKTVELESIIEEKLSTIDGLERALAEAVNDNLRFGNKNAALTKERDKALAALAENKEVVTQ